MAGSGREGRGFAISVTSGVSLFPVLMRSPSGFKDRQFDLKILCSPQIIIVVFEITVRANHRLPPDAIWRFCSIGDRESRIGYDEHADQNRRAIYHGAVPVAIFPCSLRKRGENCIESNGFDVTCETVPAKRDLS